MNPEFKIHKLNESGLEKCKQIAEEFDKLLIMIAAFCPQSREISIVKTKLEESCFFAKKAIAVQPSNQED